MTIPILKKIILSLFSVFFLAVTVTAQGLKSWSVEPSLYVGKIIKHTPKLLFNPDHLTYGAELNFLFQTYGKREWNELQRYPLLGVALTYHDLGDNDVFGKAYGVLPNINVLIHNRDRLKVYFQMGTGIAYLTKEFSVISNPTFNAIGSHVNTIANFEFIAGYRANENWVLSGGLSLTHYSNGGAHLPNFGLNMPSLSLGARYEPQPISRQSYIDHQASKEATHKWGVTAYTALAYRERIIPGGPSFPVYIGSVGALYYLNRVNRINAGVEYEYNTGVYAFGTHVYAFSSEREARWKSSRIMVYAADEFLFGNWSVTVLMGAYTGNFAQINFPIYNKLITRYYFPPIGPLRMHVGLYLKSHIVVAEYIGIGVGMAIE